MKKLLLTLGTAASIAAPLATVVACEEEKADTPVVENPGGDSDGDGAGTGGDEEVVTPEEQLKNIEALVAGLSITSTITLDDAKLNTGLIAIADINDKLGIPVDTFNASIADGWTTNGVEWDATADKFILSVKHTSTDTDYDITLSNIEWASHKNSQIIIDAIEALEIVDSTLQTDDPSFGDSAWGEEPTTFETMISNFRLLNVDVSLFEDTLMAGGAKAGDWVLIKTSNYGDVVVNDGIGIVFHHKDDSSTTFIGEFRVNWTA